MKRLFCLRQKTTTLSRGFFAYRQKTPHQKSSQPKTHHEIHSRPATATNSRLRAAKHVPRDSPYSHASSIDPGFVEISLACIHAKPHCCCCVACIHLGALFSRRRSFFCFLYRDIYMYFRFRGCPVVLDIELSVGAWYHKTRRALYCCARGVFCCCCFWQQRAEIAGVRCSA